MGKTKAKATPAPVEAEISDQNSELSDSDDDLFVLVEKPKKAQKASPGKKKSEESEKHICKLCKTPMQSSSNLMRHISKMHEGAIPVYVCGYCSEKFASKTAFNQHIKTHKSK